MPHRPQTHRPLAAQAKMPRHQASATELRGSAAARGYGHRWRKMRRLVLHRDPLCIECLKSGTIRPSIDVDHVKAKRDGGDDSMENLQGLCKACHSRKTMAGR